MSTPAKLLIQKSYHSYRHTVDIDKKGLFFSPSCMQICRPIPAYAATTREQIVQYLKDAQDGNVPVEGPPSGASNATDTSSNAEAVSTTPIPATDARSEPKPNIMDEEKINGKSVYTIRALRPAELEFGPANATSSIGYTPSQLLQKANDENWMGMRVDLWDEGPLDKGLLVKVQYWWRKEAVNSVESMEGDSDGFGWRQCLHDIMYLGPKDGSEGLEGLQILK